MANIMNTIKFIPKFLLLTAIMMLSLSSCIDNDSDHYGDIDNHYSSPLVGTWELIEDRYGPIPQSETNIISFYTDGEGLYKGYNIYERWDNWNIYWDSYYNSELIIYFPDGEQWYYFWEINKGYLLLYDMDDTNYYYIYRPLYW